MQNSLGEDHVPPLALRPREAAAALGISERTLWGLKAQGRIPFVQVGRVTLYPVRELEAWLTARATPAGEGVAS